MQEPDDEGCMPGTANLLEVLTSWCSLSFMCGLVMDFKGLLCENLRKSWESIDLVQNLTTVVVFFFFFSRCEFVN